MFQQGVEEPPEKRSKRERHNTILNPDVASTVQTSRALEIQRMGALLAAQARASSRTMESSSLRGSSGGKATSARTSSRTSPRSSCRTSASTSVASAGSSSMIVNSNIVPTSRTLQKQQIGASLRGTASSSSKLSEVASAPTETYSCDEPILLHSERSSGLPKHAGNLALNSEDSGFNEDSEERDLKLALQLSKKDTHMDFDSKTFLAIQQSCNPESNENNSLPLSDVSNGQNFDDVVTRRSPRITSKNQIQPQQPQPAVETQPPQPQTRKTPPPKPRPIKTQQSPQPITISNTVTEEDSFYNPEDIHIRPGSKRLIVVDGMNVGHEHAAPVKRLSVRGIAICVEFFMKKGHEVVVFLPREHRVYNLLDEEEKEQLNIMEISKLLVYCPTKAYDDLFTIKYAASRKGIVVSRDKFRDIKDRKNKSYTEQVEKRRLEFSFRNDTFMIADDPLGRYGPPLHKFLKHE